MTSGIARGESLQNKGSLWWATSGPPDAPIALLGEAWGSEEKARFGRPFVGAAGQELDRILAEAGLARDSIFCLNIFNGQPENNALSTLFEPGPATVAGLAPGPEIKAGLERVKSQLGAYPRKLVVAAGNYPLWALTGVNGTNRDKTEADPRPGVLKPSGIGDQRGSQLWTGLGSASPPTRIPVLPIYHPAGILRQWTQRSITVHDLRTRVPLAMRSTWDRPRPYRFDHMPSLERIVGQISSWLYSKEKVTLAADIETKANTIITCIGLADSSDYALCIPFVRLEGTGKDRRILSFWSASDEILLWKMLCALFRAPHVEWIGQNFLYDMQFLQAELGVVPSLAHDTMIAQNLLFPGTPKALGYLSSIYCEHHRYWKDDSREWDIKGSLEQHLLYNCEDAARTWEIAARQKQALEHTGLASLWPFELYKFRLAWRMMRRGVIRDREATKSVGFQIFNRKLEVDSFLLHMVPQATIADSGIKTKKLWVTSPKQLQFLLYDVWGLKVQRAKKSKRPSTGKIALQALRDLYPRLTLFFDMLAESRSLGVIYANCIQSKDEPDGRMHGSFNPAGTETFRWSSSQNAFRRGMNMQNIPAGGADWLEVMPEEDTLNGTP